MKELRDVEEFLRVVQWPVRDLGLYREALTHSSYAYEAQDIRNNERLEYLGDAVLELVISEYFFNAFPGYPEGKLTLLRHRMVNEKSLASIARGLQLGSYLRLGRGEAASGGADKPSLLADALEALAGALFLDLGYIVAKDLILDVFASAIRAVEEGILPLTDFKSLLQERCQSINGQPPVYEIVQEIGPPHAKIFEAVVKIGDKIVGRGEGKSKKEAEQVSAQGAWEFLNSNS